MGTNIDCRLPLGPRLGGSNFTALFERLVDTYSGLSLTSETDKLNAFQGILHALETGFGERFFWAMPLSFLESALSWNLGVQRNDASHILRQNCGNIVAVPFPSWSWVGWIGRYNIDGEEENKWENDKSVLRFYHIDEGGTIQELVPPKRDQGSLNESLPLWMDSTRTIITAVHSQST